MSNFNFTVTDVMERLAADPQFSREFFAALQQLLELLKQRKVSDAGKGGER